MSVRKIVIAGTQIEVTPNDFDTESKYLELKKKVLVDAKDGYLVTPVRLESFPHFRRLVGGKKERPVAEPRDDDETHKMVIAFLMRILSACTGPITVRTRLFSDADSTDSTLPIVAAIDGGSFQWMEEGAVRIFLDDERYIQPDIAGRHTKMFLGRPSQPSVVIEVIRTHAPELTSFTKLLELSKAGHIVLLYFVEWNQRRSAYSNFSSRDNSRMSLIVNHYLHDGEFYRCGVAFPRFDIESEHDYFVRIKDQFLAPTLAAIRAKDNKARNAAEAKKSEQKES